MNSLRLLPFLALATAHAAEMFPFQLPWDDASDSATNVSWLNDKPAGRDGFVRVKDGHLFAGEKRLRIFGVNTCFAANFPDKEMAPKVAARMAKFGINCVRFHHMDMMSAPGGIFAKDGLTLHPGQLDRLDFFIAELKKNGIYADLNLHVSRTYPDRPRAEKNGNPDYDKGVDNYCAAMIALQKDYARDLLTHVNAYTGNRYADEPAVALVEINNENALGFQWWAGQMDDLPDVYRAEWETQWSVWLAIKYGTNEKNGIAWADGARLPGREILCGDGTATGPATPEMLKETKARPAFTEAHWLFEQHEGAVAKGTVQDGAITFAIEKPGTAQWHCQFGTAGLTVAKDGRYEVRFRVKAPKESNISVTLMQSHEPWAALGETSVKAGPEWREVTALISTKGADANARLTIGGMGLSTGNFEFAGFSLRTAPIDGAVTRDATGHFPMVKKRELSKYTPAKQRDWQEFIWDTETAYWNGMRDFLKKELGVKAPIVGTQGAWSPGHVQAGMDVIDSHAYWHHPDFHGRGWNADVWEVKNEPMAGAPDGGTLPGLAAQRVAGKPFLCTEYNHPAPNTYSAETFPLLCAFAGVQDWDGVFAFSYSHRGPGEWAQETFNNFFDIDRHPVKMATLPAAVISFRRGDMWAEQVPKDIISLGRDTALQASLRRGPSFAAGEFFYDGRRRYPRARLAMKLVAQSDSGRSITEVFDAAMPEMFWETKSQFARATILSRRSYASIGMSLQTSGRHLFGGEIIANPTRQDWACYQLTVLDRDERAGFSSAKHILITATGDIENTGMGWKDAAKTSVGRDWGRAPVLVEGPAAKIELPGGGKFKAWALDERGQRRAEIPVTNGTLEIGPQWKTLWYEVERQ